MVKWIQDNTPYPSILTASYAVTNMKGTPFNIIKFPSEVAANTIKAGHWRIFSMNGFWLTEDLTPVEYNNCSTIISALQPIWASRSYHYTTSNAQSFDAAS